MSGTGTSTGDFDDDQKGFVTEPEPAAAAGSVFAEVAGATAMPEEVPTAEHTAPEEPADADGPE